MSGIMMALLAGGGGVVTPLTALNVTDTVLLSTADATLRFDTNGAVTSLTNSNGVQQITDWYQPNITGIGNQFWIRATLSSGTSPTGSALNTWLQLSSPASWRLTQTTNGSRTCTLAISIATDSGGTNVVTTGTATITATYEV